MKPGDQRRGVKKEGASIPGKGKRNRDEEELKTSVPGVSKEGQQGQGLVTSSGPGDGGIRIA